MSPATQELSASPAAPAAPRRSAVEIIKENSRQLRGTLGEELASGADHFNDQSKQLLKFHGSYQQEDRDARKSRRKEGAGKYYMFMVRCRIPGGRITPDQYLAIDRIAGEYANGTLRFTTRQGIQLHGVLMSNLKATIADINACLLTTLGACGDVERNVMACPAPCRHSSVHHELQETAKLIAAHLAPRSRAYHEIWLNGQPVGPAVADQDVEPIYGKVYLPRKFKTGLGLPEDNCVDIYAQDLGLLALVEDGKIAGYNVLVGGGMGMTHGNASTFPYLAKPICYVPARAVLNTAEAVVKLFRDHGNRADRKRARIKYVVHDWGVDKFRQVLAEYIGGKLDDPRPIDVKGFETHLGWHPQGDGKFYFGLHVLSGRVKDEGSLRLRSGLKALVERFRPEMRITPVQDLLLCDLDPGALPEIVRTLAEFGIAAPPKLSPLRTLSMACPAIPTCGLAISESERCLPALVEQFEQALARLGLQDEKISLRMTGCPNGCARPYQSDIGVVGRSGEKYVLYVGGNVLGNRLNFELRDLVPLQAIVPTLLPLLNRWKQDRQAGEGFGDWCQRMGKAALEKLMPPLEKPGAAKSEAKQEAHAAAVAGNGEVRPASAVPPTAKVPAFAVSPVSKALSTASPAGAPLSETFYAGHPGQELADYTYRCGSDGSVRETVVSYYGNDLRAAEAHPGIPLRREAVYQGQVNPYRLHAARKLHDIYYVGDPGRELPDYRIDYYPDGEPAQTVIYFYDGDVRAGRAAFGAALSRKAIYPGKV
jgi:sulfite reductase (ferredoxin)